jgi:hypothetical protein
MRRLRHASHRVTRYAPPRLSVRTYSSTLDDTGPSEGASLNSSFEEAATADPVNAPTAFTNTLALESADAPSHSTRGWEAQRQPVLDDLHRLSRKRQTSDMDLTTRVTRKEPELPGVNEVETSRTARQGMRLSALLEGKGLPKGKTIYEGSDCKVKAHGFLRDQGWTRCPFRR